MTLSYNSRAGNGLVGVGWSLSGLSTISRCAPTYATEGSYAQDSNPRYTNSDRLCLDGQKLEIASPTTAASDSAYWTSGAEYRTEIDSFARIKAYGTHNGAHQYFEVHTKDGRILTYGGEDVSQNSRIYAPGQGSSGPVSVWALDKVKDRYNNQYTIHYTRNNADGDYYPAHILFSPGASVVFTYENRDADSSGPRSDMPFGYDKGFIHRHPKLLDKITTYINVTSTPTSGTKVREYDVDYTRSATTDRYLVSEIKECGFDGGTPACAKPLEFEWQAGELSFEANAATLSVCGTQQSISLSDQAVVDIDNDGYVDIVGGITNSSTTVYWGTADNCFEQTSSWTITGDSGAAWGSGKLINTPRGYGWIVVNGSPAKLGVVEVTDRLPATLNYKYLTAVNVPEVHVLDINNDGLDDFINNNAVWVQSNANPASFTNVGTAFGGTPPASEEIAFGDYTSDGLADLMALSQAYENQGNNQFSYDFVLPQSDSTNTPVYYGAITVSQLPASQFRNALDLNGDGLMDLAWHRKPVSGSSNPGYWYARLNTGDGFTATIDNSLSSGTQTNQYSYSYDWDKDGRMDLIVPNTSYTSWRVLVSTYNNGGFAFKEVTSPHPFNGNLDGLASLTIGTPSAQILRGDFNNDGLIDLTSVSSVWYAKQQQPDLLKTVTDGFGAEVKFEYSPLVNTSNNGQPLYTPSINVVFPERHANRSMQVVKKLSVSNGLGGYRHRYFNYTGAKTHAQGRGFLGFEKIEVADTSQDTVTIILHRQDFPFIGLIYHMEVKDGDARRISISDNHYMIHGSNARFPYLEYGIQQQYGLVTTSASSPISVTKTQNTFDSYGNLTNQTTTIGNGLSGTTVTSVKRVITTTNTVTNDVANWLLGFVEVNTVQTSFSGGTGSRTVTTEFDPQSGTLDVAARRDFYGTSVEKTTTITRNSNGVITTVSAQADDLGGTTTAARTTTLGSFTSLIYPGTRTNALGHVTTLAYDTRFGVVDSETDPNNLPTTRDYDLLGRLTSEMAPDGTVTSIIRYECATAPVTCPSGASYLIATEVRNAGASGKLGAPLQIVYYDALQRELRRETYSLAGAVIKVDTEYYADGRIHRVSEPFTGFSAMDWTVYAGYDALNRPQTVTHADGGSIEYSFSRYNGLLKTVETVNVLSPASSQVTTRYTNPLGQIVQVLDAANTPVDYTYDSQGNLATTQVNNNSDTLITLVHDVAGNKTSINDPDAGMIDFQYNGFGELRRQVWQQNTADEKSMTFTYDVLGRKVTRTDYPSVGSHVGYTWTWDSNNKKGLLGSQAGNGMSETYVYDNQSRLQTLTTAITGLSSSRVFSYTYDAFSRPLTVTYPDTLKVEYQYHAAGLQVQTRDITDINNPKLLWTLGSGSDERGNLYQQRFGNGVITLSDFDPTSGRTTRTQTGWPTSGGIAGIVGSIQDLSYEYDTLGNLYQRMSAREPLDETIAEVFDYDSLNRLVSSDTTWYETNPPAPRGVTYGYDALGNLTSRSDTGTLSYSQTGNAGVHAVTSANGQTYSYDKYGNLIQRGSQTLDYDVFNKPTRIGTTYFSYGPEHQRYKQVDGGRTTYYINGGQYEEIVEGATTTKRSYVGGYLVRSTVGSTSTLTYLHKDHLGSVEAMTNASGNMVTVNRMSFDPWGKRQDDHWESSNPTAGDPDHYPTTRGYTGHEHLDQVNLIHMNGRVYDPTIGRFLSADLYIQAPFNSQSFNRYSYTWNNPLSYVDPSGYLLEICIGGFSDTPPSQNACNGGGSNPPPEPPGGGDCRGGCPHFSTGTFGMSTSSPGNFFGPGGPGSGFSMGAGMGPMASFGIGPAMGSISAPQVSFAGGSGYSGIHATLNAASMAMDATGVGAAFSWVPDLADAGLSAYEGDWTGAGISMASMIPFIGIGANAGKLGHIAKKFPIPKVSDPKLANLVNDLYKGAKGPNPIGTGSTADAIRNELATGLPTHGTFHSQKGEQYINALNNWMSKNPNASYYDQLVAESLKLDLQDALGRSLP